MPRDPIAEMGQGVREECAPEEVRHIVVPAHCCSLLAATPMVAGLRRRTARRTHTYTSCCWRPVRIQRLQGQLSLSERDWSFYIFSSGGSAGELGVGDFAVEFLQK